MTTSIISQLVRKDLHIMRKSILWWWAGGVAAIIIAVLSSQTFIFSMILFIACMMGAGIHMAIRTVVEERREQTLAFIMSLPITVKEYTSAKLIANLAVFLSVWLTLSGASFVIFLGSDSLPIGAIPFVIIVLVGIFLGNTLVLATSLITESMGWAIGSTVVANLGNQIFLRWVAALPGISSMIGGDIVAWNQTVMIVIAGQLIATIALLATAYAFQVRKTDFI